MALYPNGVDFSTFTTYEPLVVDGRTYYGGPPDLDPSWTPIGGIRTVLEHVARRLISPPGSYDDPEYGFDLNSYMNANLLTQDLDALTAAIRDQAEAVEGVNQASVVAKIDPATRALLVKITVTLTDQVEGYQMVFVLGPDTIPRIYFPTVTTSIV